MHRMEGDWNENEALQQQQQQPAHALDDWSRMLIALPQLNTSATAGMNHRSALMRYQQHSPPRAQAQGYRPRQRKRPAQRTESTALTGPGLRRSKCKRCAMLGRINRRYKRLIKQLLKRKRAREFQLKGSVLSIPGPSGGMPSK